MLYPDCGGRCLDSHKAFVVKYDMKEDLDLSYHYDNAEVTLNVCLGKTFTEGGLYFGDMRQVHVFSSPPTQFTMSPWVTVLPDEFGRTCSRSFLSRPPAGCRQ